MRRLLNNRIWLWLSLCSVFYTLSVDAEMPTGTTIKVGIVGNFSSVRPGVSNPMEHHLRNGAQLAVYDLADEANAVGLAFELLEFDHGVAARKILSVTRQTIESPVLGVVGYIRSSEALLAAPLYQHAHLPMITPTASANRLAQFHPYVMQTCFDNHFVAMVIQNVLLHIVQARRIAVVAVADCAYCQDLAATLVDRMRVTDDLEVERFDVLADGRKLSTMAHQVVSKKPFDAIVVPNQEIESARIIRALLDAGVSGIPFIGGDGWGSAGEQFFYILKDKRFDTYSLAHWHADAIDETAKVFRSRYVKQFKKDPESMASSAYDAVQVLLQAIIAAPEKTREGIARQLRSLHEYHGVTGTMLFHPTRAPEKSVVILSSSGEAFRIFGQYDPMKKRIETMKRRQGNL